jgi:tetratricopeptide (TPR) repeat protein
MIERLLAAESALDRGELDVAGRLFGQVADADPRNAIAVVGIARVALRRDDRIAARELARRALAIDPHEAAAKRLLAELETPAPERAPASAPPPPPTVEVGLPVPPPATARTAEPPRSWLRRLLARFLDRG